MPAHPIRTLPAPTIFGLLVAAFGVIGAMWLQKLGAPAGPWTNGYVATRELTAFAVTGLLLFIVVYGEKLPLASVGLHHQQWGRALLWTVPVYLACMAAALLAIGLCKVLGLPAPAKFASHYENVSLWLMTLVTVRAGIVEEICYRGYLQARLERINGHWAFSVLLPSVFFGLLHYVQGLRGILVATAVGLVLAVVYRRTRDLKANILAHFLVDFLANVVPLLTK